MFYILNDENNGKKKNSNPYRKALKGLVKEIKSIDLDSLVRVNNIGSNNGIAKIEELALWIKSQDDNINYKEIENRLRDFYKSSSSEELIYIYISVLNNVLYEYCLVTGAEQSNLPLESIFSDYDEHMVRVKSRTLIALVCLYAIVFEEKLLDKKIDIIDVKDNHRDTKIIKAIKSEKMSLFKGYEGVPLLLTKKEAQFVNSLIQKIKTKDVNGDLLEYIKIIYSHRCLEDFVSMYCFGKELNDYVNRKEFTKMEVMRKENERSFIMSVKLLHKRKVLPPTNGVVLKLENHKNIESVYIRECTRFNFRIIYGVVRYNDGHEQQISIRMNYYPTVFIHCIDAHDVLSVILDFYGVPKEELEKKDDLPKPAEYTVLSPYYWKYRDKGYETKGEKTLRLSGKKVKREETVRIATYVRKIKGNASEEARKLATKIHIHLEENQTLVREHDRVYSRSEC